LALADKANVVFCQVPPWQLNGDQFNLKKKYRRYSFLVSRLMANAGVAGPTRILERFQAPFDITKLERRWQEGLYVGSTCRMGRAISVLPVVGSTGFLTAVPLPRANNRNTLMGMDVVGRQPTSAAGRYFQTSVWSWRPIQDLIVRLCFDLLDDDTLVGISYNDGAGPEGQAPLRCGCFADDATAS
jgi:hypothetical protein